MKLFLLSELSDLILYEILESTDYMIVATDQNVASQLFQRGGIISHVLSAGGAVSTGENDSDFFEKYMPGKLDGLEIDGYPIHKSLSVDRLKFWYIGRPLERLVDLILQIRADELVVSADIKNPIIWSVAEKFDGCVTAVKTESLRTREFYDYYPDMPIDIMVVSFPDEEEYLKKACPEKKVRSRANRKEKRVVEFQERGNLKASLGIPANKKVVGFIYDRRDMWQYKRAMSGAKGDFFPIAFPYDTRSSELFYLCDFSEIPLVESERFLDACDEVVMFRFLESVYNLLPKNTNVLVYDFFDINRSMETGTGCKVFV